MCSHRATSLNDEDLDHKVGSEGPFPAVGFVCALGPWWLSCRTDTHSVSLAVPFLISVMKWMILSKPTVANTSLADSMALGILF